MGWGQASEPNGLHLDRISSVVKVEVARLAPDELLVILMPPDTHANLIDAINAACADSAFHGRVLVLAAAAQAFAVGGDGVRPARQTINLADARVREFLRP